MKLKLILFILSIIAFPALAFNQVIHIPETIVNDAFAGKVGSLVFIDCSSGEISDFHPNASSEPLAPCSTFKIWNTLIGLEIGVISSAEQTFYRWDGEVRAIPDWNKDLNLKEAFQVSCVPAFQNLAREVGSRRMQSWVDKIGYGNRDTSAGIDLFWLPAPGRKTLLITPREQARLIYELVSGKLPFSEKSRRILKEIMKTKVTDRGILYGKTGSGGDNSGTYVLGWYVGYVESKGRTYAFACNAKGNNISGKDARNIVETVFKKQGLL